MVFFTDIFTDISPVFSRILSSLDNSGLAMLVGQLWPPAAQMNTRILTQCMVNRPGTQLRNGHNCKESALRLPVA